MGTYGEVCGPLGIFGDGTDVVVLNCVLPVIHESTDAPATGTWLFTT